MLGTYFVENADLEKLRVLEVNVCICNDVREFGIVRMLFFCQFVCVHLEL